MTRETMEVVGECADSIDNLLGALPEPSERGEQMHDFPPSLYTSEQVTAYGLACYAAGAADERAKWTRLLPAPDLSQDPLCIFTEEPSPSAAARAEPTLPVEIYGKFYDVPIPVQVHIVALEERLRAPTGGKALTKLATSAMNLWIRLREYAKDEDVEHAERLCRAIDALSASTPPGAKKEGTE